MFVRALLIFVVANSITGENQFISAVRNLTDNSNSNQTKRTSKDGNVLRTEVLKYLNECKADLTFDFPRDIQNKYRTSNSDGKHEEDEGNMKTYLTYYNPPESYNKEHKRSDRENRNFDDDNIDGYLTSYRNGDRHHNRHQKDSCSGNEGDYNYRRSDGYHNNNNDGNDRRYYEEFGINYSEREKSRSNLHDPNEYRRNQENYNGDSNNPYGHSTNYPRPYSRRNVNYRSNDDFNRWKREGDNCVAQCIFGYMELLDENNIPSESATIKFLQDHTGNDRKRLKLVRDSRRCFAKLATTENEDECALSKALAKCLRLNME
ncbi:hypothetical protein Trydic_g5363 [Trypoxylus dichotomus]